MSESRTCGNCDNAAVCFLPAGQCNMWQPIPVAATDAKATAWEQLGADIDAILRDRGAPEPQTEVDWLKWTQQLKGDIAKRDDLIRRMAELLHEISRDEWESQTSADCLDLEREADELLGVK